MIPLKSSDLVFQIMNEYDLNVEAIAQKLGVSQRSIQRVLKGEKPSGKMVVGLIRLYLQLSSDLVISH